MTVDGSHRAPARGRDTINVERLRDGGQHLPLSPSRDDAGSHSDREGAGPTETLQFDVVAIYGLYYHVMDHYGLLNLCHQMSPKLIIIDSEFALAEEPIIRLAEEPTSSHLNSVAYTPDQVMAPVGIPSRSAMEVMARSLGYEVTWTD